MYNLVDFFMYVFIHIPILWPVTTGIEAIAPGICKGKCYVYVRIVSFRFPIYLHMSSDFHERIYQYLKIYQKETRRFDPIHISQHQSTSYFNLNIRTYRYLYAPNKCFQPLEHALITFLVSHGRLEPLQFLFYAVHAKSYA